MGVEWVWSGLWSGLWSVLWSGLWTGCGLGVDRAWIDYGSGGEWAVDRISYELCGLCYASGC